MKKLLRLEGIISNFNQARILVVGDLMLDEFIWGDVSRKYVLRARGCA